MNLSISNVPTLTSRGLRNLACLSLDTRVSRRREVLRVGRIRGLKAGRPSAFLFLYQRSRAMTSRNLRVVRLRRELVRFLSTYRLVVNRPVENLLVAGLVRRLYVRLIVVSSQAIICGFPIKGSGARMATASHQITR